MYNYDLDSFISGKRNMYAEGWIKTRNEEDTKRRRHETKKTRNESFNVWVRILTKRRTTQVLINCRQAHQFVQFSHFKFNSRQVFLPINPFPAIRNTAVLRISFSEQTHLALMTSFQFWKRLQLRS